jgi:hypothetical protein
MPISAETNEKQTVSARVNRLIYEEYKKSEIPISTVVEAGLIYFLKLDEDEKMKYISQNLPETVEKEDLKPLNKSWTEYLTNMLTAIGIPTVIAGTMSLGPFSSLATLFVSGFFLGNAINKTTKVDKKKGRNNDGK